MAHPVRDGLKLLLDEMHSPRVASALQARGHDVEAIASDPGRKAMADADVLAWATDAGMAVVTENVADFRRLADDWALRGRVHRGIVYTAPSLFVRSSNAYPGSLIAALSAFLSTPPPITRHRGWEWWLRSGGA